MCFTAVFMYILLPELYVETFNDLLQLTYRRTLKVYNVIRAVLDRFIWTPLIQKVAPLAFVSEQPIIAAVQINEE